MSPMKSASCSRIKADAVRRAPDAPPASLIVPMLPPTPGVVHAFIQLAGGQAKPGLPRPGHAEVRGELQHAADVEHNRLDPHDSHADACPQGQGQMTSGSLTTAHRLGHWRPAVQ